MFSIRIIKLFIIIIICNFIFSDLTCPPNCEFQGASGLGLCYAPYMQCEPIKTWAHINKYCFRDIDGRWKHINNTIVPIYKYGKYYLDETSKCPKNCFINNEKCITRVSGYDCEFNNITLKCPHDCFYNKNKCIKNPTSSNDIICDPYIKYKLITNDFDSIINNDIVILSCPKYYEFKFNFKECLDINKKILDICFFNNTIIIPNKIKNKYDLKCSRILDFCSLGTSIESCPNGCYLDEFNNKCLPSNGQNFICGTDGIKCPINYTSAGTPNPYGCVPPPGLYMLEPKCEKNYRLEYITYSNSYVRTPRCIPDF